MTAPERVAPAPQETSVVAIIGSLRRRRRLILTLAGAGLLIGGVFGMFQPHTFTSHASFTADDSRGGAGGVAGQLGLGSLLGALAQPSQLYLDVVGSPVILGPVADSVYDVPTDSGTRRETLVQFLGTGRNALERRDGAISTLKNAIKVEPKPSGIVNLDVKSKDRRLSQEIATRVLEQLNQFSLDRRQARAANERVFSEGRLAEALAELRQAEDRLEAFEQQNRAYHNSPALETQQERLQRDVAFRQGLYTSIAQTYEQARLEEARNTPTVSVVEPASFPVRQDPRWGGLISGVLGAVIGALLGMLIAVTRDFATRVVQANEDDAAALGVVASGSVRRGQRTAGA